MIPFIQVGVGNRGANILQDLLAHHGERFTPAGFVDLVPACVKAAQQMAGIDVPAYATLGEALAAQPRTEAVFIVTPARFHESLIREALLAGKHVWVEKPLTYSYTEALALAALARQAGRAVVVGNQYQYDPIERRLQGLVQSGNYGRPVLVSYVHHRCRPEMRAFTGEYPVLWEQGVHSLNSILAILGDPDLRTVYALGQRPAHSQYRSDSVTSLLTEFADGTQAHVLLTFDSHRTDWEVRIECARAALLMRVEGGQRQPVQVIAGEQVVSTHGPASDIDPAIADTYIAFYTAATTGRSVPTAIDVNLKTIQWIDAAVRSLRAHQPIFLP